MKTAKPLPPVSSETLARIMQRVRVTPTCHLWLGPVVRGYGRVYVAGRNVFVHRVVWTVANGPIPPELVIDHICRVRNCVNVAHLRVVTTRENTIADGSEAIAAKNVAKTHCDNGHKYDVVDGRTSPRRRCRQCRLAKKRKWHDANRERINARARARYAADPERFLAKQRERAQRKKGT